MAPAYRAPLALLLCLTLGCLSACGGSPPAPSSSHRLTVVAGENFWGSIAAQLAGDRATVTSIIANPNTDPHNYEPTAQDARTIAGGRMAIVNGVGYDPWMLKALAANPVNGRLVLDIGHRLGLKGGENPHQWYSPRSVRRVTRAIAAAYKRLDPGAAAYFDARRRTFETEGLAEYDRLRREIRRRFSGVPVGYSESIFAPLGRDLGLRLLTPSGFADAVAEGTDVSAGDKRTVDEQAQRRRIKVWVYNSQNATPDVQRINTIARTRGIPIATVTETLSPATDSFERWQVAQLRRLMAALHRATGR